MINEDAANTLCVFCCSGHCKTTLTKYGASPCMALLNRNGPAFDVFVSASCFWGAEAWAAVRMHHQNACPFGWHDDEVMGSG
jgi:hypothetical protein